MRLAFGLSGAVPDDVATAWGARLIAPDDLLHDRQDLVAEDDGAKASLVDWLNGGAIRKALDESRERYNRSMHGDRNEQHVLYGDNRGIIVGNTNASGGYVYLAGWLHPGVSAERYEIRRMPITVERWEHVYGWSHEEAAKFGEGSEEVRVFVHGADGERQLREHDPDAFNMGYGGSGPHETAKAIVSDLTDCADLLAPVDYQALVHEVFWDAQGKDRVVVYAADVEARMSKIERDGFVMCLGDQ